MEQSKALGKVRALIERAEHPSTPKAEADLCRARADKIMEDYAINEWQLANATGIGTKPERIKIDIGRPDSMFLSETASLVNIIATFTRCRSMWMKGSGWGSKEEYCWVYGYESDLRYFEMLFTTIYLHMSGAIFPAPHPEKSVGVNAYEMHNAGLNWYDIAQAYGWTETDRAEGEPQHMYLNKGTGERASWAKTIGRIKAAYNKEVKARGEQPFRIPPNGSENFRRNAAAGYLVRIRQRLDEQLNRRGTGAELVLKDRSQNIADMIADEHPDASVESARQFRFNGAAYGRGVRHANEAALNPQAGSAPSGALR
jgi:hypothetical protein